MNLRILTLAVLLATPSAYAYDAGTFTCPGKGQLPPNVYLIKKLELGGVTLPYLEVTRHFLSNGSGEPQTSTMKGIATETSLRGKTTLILEALTLELTEGNLRGCTFTPETL